MTSLPRGSRCPHRRLWTEPALRWRRSFSAFSDIRTRVVEQKSGPLLLGQADGVACRTIEMFEAFGFSEARLERGLLGQRDVVLEARRQRARQHRSEQPGSRTSKTGCLSSRMLDFESGAGA